MQSLLGVDLFGTHGDDMKQISDKKEHQTQNRIRGEYEGASWRWRCRRCSRPGRRRACARGIASWPSTGRRARGEAPLVVTEGQQEAAADFS